MLQNTHQRIFLTKSSGDSPRRSSISEVFHPAVICNLQENQLLNAAHHLWANHVPWRVRILGLFPQSFCNLRGCQGLQITEAVEGLQ